MSTSVFPERPLNNDSVTLKIIASVFSCDKNKSDLYEVTLMVGGMCRHVAPLTNCPPQMFSVWQRQLQHCCSFSGW